MDTLPVELVFAIATELKVSGDIGSFRLTCRSFSAIGLPLQAQHIAALDSFQSLTRLACVLNSNSFFAQYTTHFTLYHASWVICSMDIWEIRGCLDYGEYHHMETKSLLSYTFEQHQQFIATEARRELHLDAALISRLLHMLPRLKTITVAPMPIRKLNRHEQISVHPFDRDSAGMACSRILPVLSHFPHVQELEIRGRIDPRDLHWHTLTHIRKLHVSSLILSLVTRNSMASLFQCFPSLQELHLGAAEGMHGLILFDNVFLPDLRTVQLKNLWITAEGFEALINQHPLLRNIAAVGVTLSTGSWGKLLSVTRISYPRIKVVIENCRLNPYRYRIPHLYSYS
ncbi:hypothetical protein F5B17DRAFT_284403 [Nemania serpens]|nr:hypothetical protein F5B17DRAFT_284403 [Nemania serpens]